MQVSVDGSGPSSVRQPLCLKYSLCREVACGGNCMQLQPAVGTLKKIHGVGTCTPNPGEFFLCTPDLVFCLYRTSRSLDLRQRGWLLWKECMASISASEFTICPRPPGTGSSKEAEDASQLLQTRPGRRIQVDECLVTNSHQLLPRSFTAMTFNGTDSSTWSLTTGAYCLEESRDGNGYQLQLVGCAAPGEQSLSEAVLRQGLQPTDFTVGKQEVTCPTQWPNCQVQISGCTGPDGLPLPLAAFSITGGSPTACTNTPVVANQSAFFSMSYFRIRTQQGLCLLGDTASGRISWGSCLGVDSIWRFMTEETLCTLLQIFDEGGDPQCLYLNYNGYPNNNVLLDCYGSGFNCMFQQIRMYFDNQLHMLWQFLGDEEQRTCFGSEGTMSCNADGKLSLDETAPRPLFRDDHGLPDSHQR